MIIEKKLESLDRIVKINTIKPYKLAKQIQTYVLWETEMTSEDVDMETKTLKDTKTIKIEIGIKVNEMTVLGMSDITEEELENISEEDFLYILKEINLNSGKKK